MLRRILFTLSLLFLTLPALAQDSGISPDTEKSGRGPLLWLVIAGVLVGVFFGGRCIYRKFASPRQRSP